MISLDRDGTTVIYLKALCTLVYFQTLLDAIGISHNISFYDPIEEDGIIEFSFDWKESLLVIQYDPFLGISMFVGCLEDATAMDLANLNEIATIMDQHLIAIETRHA